MKKMNAEEMTFFATLLAIELSRGCSENEITKIKCFLNQVVNSLSTIIAQKACDKKKD